MIELGEDFGVAVVGTGFIGPVHVEALRRAGLEVRGVLGSTPEKSRAATAKLRLATAYRSYEELLRDPRVHAVHLTSPNRFHFDQAAAALRAGKHVLCEKPLAMDARQSAALVSLAAETGLAAGVNYNLRFYPLCREAAERVRSGALGRILHIGGAYAQDWLLYPEDFNWRVLADEGGALRAVADIGTHWLDLIQHLSGLRVEELCADLQTVHAQRRRPRAGGSETFSGQGAAPRAGEEVAIDTDDWGGLLLRLSDGARGCVWISQTTAGRKNCLRYEVAGSTGALAWNSEEPNTLWAGHRDRPNELLVRDPALLSPAARGLADTPGGHAEGFADTFKQCFRAFYGAIAASARGEPRREPPGYPSFADGHREILLCEAILRSARERRWVEVDG